jgi:hypothetical protein
LLPGRRTLTHVRVDPIAALRRANEVFVTANVAKVRRGVTAAAMGGLQQQLKNTGAAQTRRIRRVVVLIALVVNTLVVGSVCQILNMSIKNATMVQPAASSCAGSARRGTVPLTSPTLVRCALKPPRRVPPPNRLQNVKSVLSVNVLSVGSARRLSWPQHSYHCRRNCRWCSHATTLDRSYNAVQFCLSIRT